MLTCIIFGNSLFQLRKAYWFGDALITYSHCQIDIQSTNSEKHDRCYLTDNCCRLTYEATRQSMAALQLYGILDLMPA